LPEASSYPLTELDALVWLQWSIRGSQFSDVRENIFVFAIGPEAFG
jgi:hypothetical protein